MVVPIDTVWNKPYRRADTREVVSCDHARTVTDIKKTPTSKPEYILNSASYRYGFKFRYLHAMKCKAKLMPAINMKMIAIVSTSGLLKYPILASCVGKPPMATVLKLCPMASNKLMPAAKYAKQQATVKAR